MGCYCFRCYLNNLARRFRLSRYIWWKGRLDIIEGALRGRYEVIRLGLDPEPVEKVIRHIWRDDPRPKWASHKVPKQRTKRAVLRVIANVDRHAREEFQNENHTGN